MKHGLLSVTSRLLAFVITSLCPTNTTPTRKSEVIQKYKYQKDVHIKGIVWEIYECVSEVLSDLGRMFGMIFRVQWSQKSPKSGINVFDQNVPGSLQGCRRGLVRVPQVGAAYQVRHPCKDREDPCKHIFPLFGDF